MVDHVPNGPANYAAITTKFPSRLCGGKLLVAVTRERRYGPRLRADYALTTTTTSSSSQTWANYTPKCNFITNYFIVEVIQLPITNYPR